MAAMGAILPIRRRLNRPFWGARGQEGATAAGIEVGARDEAIPAAGIEVGARDEAIPAAGIEAWARDEAIPAAGIEVGAGGVVFRAQSSHRAGASRFATGNPKGLGRWRAGFRSSQALLVDRGRGERTRLENAHRERD
jgi:hypothetical protein